MLFHVDRRPTLLLLSVLYPAVFYAGSEGTDGIATDGGLRFVPYWIVEVVPVPMAVTMGLGPLEQLIEDVASRLALENMGTIGSLDHIYEFHYPFGVDSLQYSFITDILLQEAFIVHVRQEEILPFNLRSVRPSYHLPTDPEFPNQWSLYNTGQSGGSSGLDINVVPVWIQGVTGSGSTIAVVDDGVQISHPDLKDNIDLSISFSFLTYTQYPTPLLSTNDYSHGTSCAGEIVMVTDNGICGTGVAYNAKLGGIQFMLSNFRPSQLAHALTYKNDAIQIYSNSYGPVDDGFTVASLGTETTAALQQATQQGRGHLGCIYVFSSGNGGEVGDSCAADGFINNIHIIGVGSANQEGRQAFYDENCSGKMATTYTYNTEGADVVTTFVSDECVSNFTGTSASAPLVSGVIALALEVNDQLSWRDVQYLIVYTSDSSKLVGGDWTTNGGGLRVSPQFGFGAVDAEAYVNRARHWIPVETAQPPQQLLLIHDKDILINKSASLNTRFTVSNSPILNMEHVIFTVTFNVKPTLPSTKCYQHSDYPINPLVVNHKGAKRGDAQIRACSPSGTCSLLLPRRPRDFINCEGYSDWDFMSVHFWGENPNGEWSFQFQFDGAGGNAILQYLSVTLYGIRNKPESIPEDPCNLLCRTRTGCSFTNSSIYCDSCIDGYYRNASTMECVRGCSHQGACVIEGTCVEYNSSTCPQADSDEHVPKSISNSTIIIIASSVAGLVLLCVFVGLVVVLLRCCDKGMKTRSHRVRTDDNDNPIASGYHHIVDNY